MRREKGGYIRKKGGRRSRKKCGDHKLLLVVLGGGVCVITNFDLITVLFSLSTA